MIHVGENFQAVLPPYVPSCDEGNNEIASGLLIAAAVKEGEDKNHVDHDDPAGTPIEGPFMPLFTSAASSASTKEDMEQEVGSASSLMEHAQVFVNVSST